MLVSLGLVALVAGGLSDEAEVDWLAERNAQSFVDLASSSMVGNDQLDRWRKLATPQPQLLMGSSRVVVKTVCMDVVALKSHEAANAYTMLRGRHMLCMVLAYVNN